MSLILLSCFFELDDTSNLETTSPFITKIVNSTTCLLSLILCNKLVVIEHTNRIFVQTIMPSPNVKLSSDAGYYSSSDNA